MIVTLAEYATLKGVSPQAIRKAISEGRLKQSVERKPRGYQIDVKLADAEWKLSFDSRIGTNYSQFRAYGEGYKAKLLELEYKEKAGLLVRADVVSTGQFKIIRMFRDAVQQIPIRVVSELAAIVGDVSPALRHEMTLVMQREIDRCLEQLAENDGPR
jgi:hypothetical protein